VGPNINDPSDDPEFYACDDHRRRARGPCRAGVFTGRGGRSSPHQVGDHQRTLNARSPTSRFRGSTVTVTARPTRQIVASFKISSHFDIKREYNPQTGEELKSSAKHHRPALVPARLHARRLVGEPGRVSNSFDPLAMLKAGAKSSNPRLPSRPPDPDHRFSSPTRILRRDQQGVRQAEGHRRRSGLLLLRCRGRRRIVSVRYLRFVEVSCGSRFSALPTRRTGLPRLEAKEWDGARFQTHTARSPMIASGTTVTTASSTPSGNHLIQPLQHLGQEPPRHTVHGVGRYRQRRQGRRHDDECARRAGSRCDDLVGQCTIPYALRSTRPNAWHYN